MLSKRKKNMNDNWLTQDKVMPLTISDVFLKMGSICKYFLVNGKIKKVNRYWSFVITLCPLIVERKFR